MNSSNPLRFAALLLAAAVFPLTALSAAAPDFTLHEWGTFTSVSGSDGVLLPGLEREEEALPPFVNNLDGMGYYYIKGYLRPLHNVTIKMETPVIYFYTDRDFDARVKVGFNGGSISQWYPARAGGETPPPYKPAPGGGITGGDIDFAKPYKGGIDWNVRITPPSPSDSASVFKPRETPSWLYPRLNDAALVRTPDGGAEKYLFYRGVGNFALPVKFTLPDNETVRIQNNSSEAVPSLLLFNRAEMVDRVGFTLIEAIQPGETRSVKIAAPGTASNWRRAVYDAMHGALVKAGLHPQEADSMVQTWWNSYFEHPGLRAFWIVPEEFTESVLPLSVSPAPRQQVRVLVGRSELLTPDFEYQMVSQFAMGDGNPLRSDRFFLAYEARFKALAAGRRPRD